MKQHYMPRCCLKRFSYKKKCIHTYAKLRCRQYNASMISVCCDDRKGRCRLGAGRSSEVQECINRKNTAAVLTLQLALADEHEEPTKGKLQAGRAEKEKEVAKNCQPTNK